MSMKLLTIFNKGGVIMNKTSKKYLIASLTIGFLSIILIPALGLSDLPSTTKTIVFSFIIASILILLIIAVTKDLKQF